MGRNSLLSLIKTGTLCRNKMLKAILKRFAKGFISGGIASVVVVINSGVTIASVADLKVWAFSLGVAFITGGILAIEKAITWEK